MNWRDYNNAYNECFPKVKPIERPIVETVTGEEPEENIVKNETVVTEPPKDIEPPEVIEITEGNE